MKTSLRHLLAIAVCLKFLPFRGEGQAKLSVQFDTFSVPGLPGLQLRPQIMENGESGTSAFSGVFQQTKIVFKKS